MCYIREGVDGVFFLSIFFGSLLLDGFFLAFLYGEFWWRGMVGFLV